MKLNQSVEPLHLPYFWVTAAGVVALAAMSITPAASASSGDIYNLGTLNGDDTAGEAINESGQVTGSTDNSGVHNHAFLYTGIPGAGGKMIDLDAWLDATNPTEGAKWSLTHVYDLNDSGLITGHGTYNDGPGGLSDGDRAFILNASALTVIPEPNSIILLIIAIWSVGLLRREA